MKYLILIFTFSSIFLSAQSPQLINYQGIARDVNGNAVRNKTIAIRFDFRQGSVSSPTVFTETQSVGTGNLGVFSTQIGKVNTSGLAQINWQSGSMFLEVSIDTTNGTNFISLGAQQLVSVPYAMLAQTVPSTFTNNVLTIGSGVGASVYTLSSTGSSPNTTITSSGGGASVTSSGTNTFNIDVPLTSISGGTNVNVQGTHPNYTINATPSLSINGNNLSISGGNVVTIPTSGTIAAVTTSVVSSGAANTTLLGPNSFSIDVPVPTFTNTGQNIITGTYPNFTVNTPTVAAGSNATLVASGAAVNTTLAPNSYSIHVPQPTLSVGSGSIGISGGNSVLIPSTPNTTITPGGIANVTNPATNSFVVSVPAPTLSIASGSIAISGGNSVLLPGSSSSSFVTSGAISVATLAANSFSLNVPQPTLSVGSGSISISGGNSVLIPSTPNTTITPGGIANVSNPATNSFVVSVPAPTLGIASGSISISGGNSVLIPSTPNTTITPGGIANVSNPATNSFVVSVPAPTLNLLTPNTLSISGGNSITIAPTLSLSGFGGGDLSVGVLSNSVNIAPALTGSGAVTVSGVFPNYTIFATPAGSVTSQTTTVTGTGLASINSTATNVYNVHVPDPALSILGNSLTITQGTAVSTATLPVSPTTSITQGGIVSVTNPATNSFVVSAPAPTFTNAGPTTISGTYPNFTVNSSTGTTYTNGAGISITSGSVITNTSPDVPVTFTNAGPTTISGTYPNFTVNSSTGTTYTNGAGISITSGSVITNTSPDVPVTFTNAGPTTISGTYPNFTVNSFAAAAQSLSIGSGSISISGGNSVLLPVDPTVSGAGIATVSAGPNYVVGVPAPTLSIASGSIAISGGNSVLLPGSSSSSFVTGGAISVATLAANSFSLNVPQPTLSVGSGSISISGGNSVLIPSTPNTTITPGGIANVSNPATNSFVVSVPAPTLGITSGSISISGGNSVLLPADPTVSGAGIATVSAGPNYVVGVPAPTLSVGSGSIAISGGNSVLLPATSSSSFVTSGAISVATLAANSFSLDVPQPTLSISSGSISISGGNSVLLPADPTVSGAGIATVSAGPNYVVGVPAPTLSVGSGSISISGGNSVLIPSTPNTTITPGGIANVSNPATNSFVVSVPAPTLTTGSGSISISGGNSVLIPSTPNTTITPGGIANVTNPATNSFVVSVPAPTLGIASGSISISGGNSVLIPSTPNTTITPGGIANVSNPATNSFVVSVPAPTLGIASGSITISGGNSVLLPSDPTVSGAGIASVSAGPNYVVGVQTPVFTNVAQNIITGSYPNYSVNTPTIANTDIALTSSAAAGPSLTTSGTNSFNINIPPASSSWSLGGNAGTFPTSNYIGTSDIQALAFRTNAVEAMRIDAIGNIGIGNSSPAVKLDVLGRSQFIDNATSSGYVTSVQNNHASGVSGGALNVVNTGVRGTNDAMLIQNFTTRSGGAGAVKTGLTIQSTGSWAPTTGQVNRGLFVDVSGADVNYSAIFMGGNIGIGHGSPNAPLQFATATASRKVVLWDANNNDNEFYGFGVNGGILRYQINSSTASHVFYSGINNVTSLELMRITGTGLVGINTAAPTEELDVTGSIKMTDGNQADGKVMVSNTIGVAAWKSSPASISFTLNQSALAVTNTMTILGSGATMTFTKQSASSEIELFLHAKAYSGFYTSGLVPNYTAFELRIDGNISTISNQHWINANAVEEYITLKAIFQGLSAGSHTISIWAKTDQGIRSSVQMSSNGGGALFVKETF